MMSIRKRRIFFTLAMFCIVILILSLTLGKSIYQGERLGTISFLTTHFLGYLFFLIMPVELVYSYHLASSENVLLSFLLALFTATAAHSIDYVIGHFISDTLLDDIIGHRRHMRIERSVEHFGNMSLFAFSVLPLSSPIAVLVAGMLQHKFRKVLLYTSAGLLIKYLALTLIVL